MNRTLWRSRPGGAVHEAEESSGIGMDRVERENWMKIAARLDQSDSAETWFCARAKAIAEGRPDPLAELGRFRS